MSLSVNFLRPGQSGTEGIGIPYSYISPNVDYLNASQEYKESRFASFFLNKIVDSVKAIKPIGITATKTNYSPVQDNIFKQTFNTTFTYVIDKRNQIDHSIFLDESFPTYQQTLITGEKIFEGKALDFSNNKQTLVEGFVNIDNYLHSIYIAGKTVGGAIF